MCDIAPHEPNCLDRCADLCSVAGTAASGISVEVLAPRDDPSHMCKASCVSLCGMHDSACGSACDEWCATAEQVTMEAHSVSDAWHGLTTPHAAVHFERTCRVCGVEQYQDAPGQSSCHQMAWCAAGHFMTKPPTTTSDRECQECVAGMFTSSDNLPLCKACSVGQHQGMAGQAVCYRCAPGRFQSTAGALHCVDCAAGRFQAHDGMATCNLCASGQSQANARSVSCHSCEPGKYQSHLGQSQCIRVTVCGAGMYTTKLPTPTSDRECQHCPVGKVTAVENMLSCQTCAAGQYQASVGQPVCKQCSPGHSQPVHGASTCLLCAAGQFQRHKGQGGCVECALGEYQGVPGATACVKCAETAYGADSDVKSSASVECLPCSAGHFGEMRPKSVIAAQCTNECKQVCLLLDSEQLSFML